MNAILYLLRTGCPWRYLMCDCATTIVLSGRRQLGWPVFGGGLSPRRQADDS